MIKGETFKQTVTVADATAVEFRFGGPQTRTIAATASGSEWSISASTSAWTAGFYAWQAWATMSDGTVCVAATGNVDLQDALAVGDIRTQARKNLEAIQGMLAGNLSEGVRRYRINNRELERYSVSELLQLESKYKAEVAREERAARGQSILGPRIAVRF